MPTSNDVARAAGVSQATVSRALSGDPRISEATRLRVRAAAEALGYVPHAAAQMLKGRRTGIVGVVVDDLANPFYSEVLDELARFFAELDYRMVVWHAGAGSHSDALAAIRERAVDGVVFTTATGASPELRAAVERRSAFVLINRTVEGLLCDQVASDNVEGGAVIARYLVLHGRTSVAYVSGAAGTSTADERETGFRAEMAALGHPVDAVRWEGRFARSDAMAAARAIMGGGVPSAIVCANDYMAFGVQDALRGLAEPHPWVIGYDDVDLAAWPAFDLTTIRQPSREMARAGARLLLERVADPDLPPRRIEFPCALVVRGSTGETPA